MIRLRELLQGLLDSVLPQNLTVRFQFQRCNRQSERRTWWPQGLASSYYGKFDETDCLVITAEVHTCFPVMVLA